MGYNKTLIYVGASNGTALHKIYKNFDNVHAFEPLPNNFQKLKNLFDNTNVIINNLACSTKDGVENFYVTKYNNSSSLAPINQKYLYTKHQRAGGTILEEIKVKTINLSNYLCSNNITDIDTLVTDCQGSDLNVLSTVIPGVVSINNIITETHQNNKMIYDNLNNEFNEHKKLLAKDYEFLYGTIDGRSGRFTEQQLLEMTEIKEWNSYWRKK